MWVTWWGLTVLLYHYRVIPTDYPSPSPVELLQAKFPVEGSSSLLPGIDFFFLETIHILLCLSQFFLFFKMWMKPFPSHEVSTGIPLKIVSASREETVSHSMLSPRCPLQSLAHDGYRTNKGRTGLNSLDVVSSPSLYILGVSLNAGSPVSW